MKKSSKELEIRLRLTKEQIIYELQVFVVYSKILTTEQLTVIMDIFTINDLEEIAEERAASDVCCNPYCIKPIVTPKKNPLYEINRKTNTVQKFSGKYYCGIKCENEYDKLTEIVSRNTQSHQLRNPDDYIKLCELWKEVVPKLSELALQLKTLIEQYKEALKEESNFAKK